MPTLWFVVPVHGRLPLASICLQQLKRTCDALGEHGIEATAVVVSTRPELRRLREMTDGLVGVPAKSRGEFASIHRDNEFLGRKFNDGIQLACDRAFNKRPADYVVPCGSDDWIDHRLLVDLPDGNTMHAFRAISFVREDGLEMTAKRLVNEGGCGLRVYPRRLMQAVSYRPCEEYRKRACDTSMLNRVRAANPVMRVVELASDPRQIVDWKTGGAQLNPYKSLRAHKSLDVTDPFEALADIFPAESLDLMAAHYGRVQVAA
jgi:hypothetical protein